MTSIYALLDPRTKEIRYIGKANRPEHRLLTHIWESHKSNSRKNVWLRELKGLCLQPILQVLETIKFSQWEERERFWIAEKRKEGLDLFNVLEGGASFYGELLRGIPKPPGFGAKIAAFWKGRHHTPEAKAKVSAKAKGRIVPEEVREKISRGLRKSEKVRLYNSTKRGRVATGRGAKGMPTTGGAAKGMPKPGVRAYQTGKKKSPEHHEKWKAGYEAFNVRLQEELRSGKTLAQARAAARSQKT